MGSLCPPAARRRPPRRRSACAAARTAARARGRVDAERHGPTLGRMCARGVRVGRMSPCGSDSTSPTTAPTSTAGRPSRACAPCRGSSRRRWPRCCGWTRVAVTCAGRTDTGVHARGQVVHVDVDREALVRCGGSQPRRPRPDALLRRLNGVLPPDVRVRAVAEAPDGFDARFSALWRRYAYRIADRPGLVDPLVRRTVLAWSRTLDLDAMNQRRRGADRRARLRGVLQAAGGRHDHPHAARPVLGARRGRSRRRPGARRRVLPHTWSARWSG